MIIYNFFDMRVMKKNNDLNTIDIFLSNSI